MKKKQIVTDGLWKNNPLFVLLLGICPALAVTDSVNKAIGMGIAIVFVLFLSNATISLIKNLIPDQIRIPVFIVIIATFVTSASMLLQAFAFPLFESLGIFLPLITVNCIILGRAEAFASKNKLGHSILDAIGSGVGFALGIIAVSLVREIIGTGHLLISNPFNESMVLFSSVNMWNFFGKWLAPSNPTIISDFLSDKAISLFIQPVGAFLVLGFLIALMGVLSNLKKEKLVKEEAK